MDDAADIYICTAGEFVLLRSSDPSSSINGLLCAVVGIKKAKVEMSVVSCVATICVTPSEIIDIGECGDYAYEIDDEIDSEYRNYCAGRMSGSHKRNVHVLTHSEHFDDKLFESKKCFYEGLFQTAIEITAIVANESSNPLALGKCFELAYRSSVALGNFEEAQQFAKQWIHLNSTSVVAMCAMGDVLASDMQYSEASQWYSRALNLDPLSPFPRHSQAKLMYSQGLTFNHDECLGQLIACVTSCRLTDSDYSPELAVEVYISIAEMFNNLGSNVELQMKALLRAVNIARSCGALQERYTASVVGMKAISRELQNVQVRVKAAEAFFVLGNLLQTLGRNIVDNGKPYARAEVTGAAAGYFQGALGAFEMSNKLTRGSNELYRTALQNMGALSLVR